MNTERGLDMSNFERDLKGLINSYSMESASNTPDWILANYLIECLKAFDGAVQLRESWYDRDPRPSERRMGALHD